MKKGLKIFLFVFIGCVVCIALYGVIRFINAGRKVGKYYPQYIYQNAYEYIDMNASDRGRLQFSFIAELEGDLYYVNEDDNLLYKTNCSGQDILSSNDQIKQMMFIDNFIVFHYDQELFVKNRTTDEVKIISALDKYSISQTTYDKGMLLYINDANHLCSYNIINQEEQVLSHNTYGFKVNGDFIYYEFYIDDFFGTGKYDGLYGMDLDGGNQNRIADVRGIRDYEIYKDMLIISSDRNVMFRIDMQNSTYTEFRGSISDLYFQLVNGHVYYTAFEDTDEDGYNDRVFVETDINGNEARDIQIVEFKDRCWVEYSDEYLYFIFLKDGADSTVRIFDKTGEIVKEITYEDSRIDEFVCLANYIVVKATEDDNTNVYIYDLDYNELDIF